MQIGLVRRTGLVELPRKLPSPSALCHAAAVLLTLLHCAAHGSPAVCSILGTAARRVVCAESSHQRTANCKTHYHHNHSLLRCKYRAASSSCATPEGRSNGRTAARPAAAAPKAARRAKQAASPKPTPHGMASARSAVAAPGFPGFPGFPRLPGAYFECLVWHFRGRVIVWKVSK